MEEHNKQQDQVRAVALYSKWRSVLVHCLPSHHYHKEHRILIMQSIHHFNPSQSYLENTLSKIITAKIFYVLCSCTCQCTPLVDHTVKCCLLYSKILLFAEHEESTPNKILFLTNLPAETNDVMLQMLFQQ